MFPIGTGMKDHVLAIRIEKPEEPAGVKTFSLKRVRKGLIRCARSDLGLEFRGKRDGLDDVPGRVVDVSNGGTVIIDHPGHPVELVVFIGDGPGCYRKEKDDRPDHESADS